MNDKKVIVRFDVYIKDNASQEEVEEKVRKYLFCNKVLGKLPDGISEIGLMRQREVGIIPGKPGIVESKQTLVYNTNANKPKFKIKVKS